MLEVNGSNWEREVIQSNIPVLVDFWAEWCSPCKAMIPVLTSVSEKLQGKVKVVSVNIENEMDLAKSNGVRSIPTLIIFVNGKLQEKLVGSTNTEKLLGVLKNYEK